MRANPKKKFTQLISAKVFSLFSPSKIILYEGNFPPQYHRNVPKKEPKVARITTHFIQGRLLISSSLYFSASSAYSFSGSIRIFIPHKSIEHRHTTRQTKQAKIIPITPSIMVGSFSTMAKAIIKNFMAKSLDYKLSCQNLLQSVDKQAQSYIHRADA